MLRSTFHTTISGISAMAWDGLQKKCGQGGYPFLKHGFLRCLEDSGSLGEQTGWIPKHLTFSDAKGLAIAMPLYVKLHSWGEYVFDHSWGAASENSGIPYYPKLLTAIPMTPCSGPRIAIRPDLDPVKAMASIYQEVIDLAEREGYSSWHVLFPSAREVRLMRELGMIVRLGSQFHWMNRNWSSQEDFLQSLTSRQRKNMRKERQSTRIKSVDWDYIRGSELGEKDTTSVYKLYQRTHLKRLNLGYLSQAFFELLPEYVGDSWLILACRVGGNWVAMASFFEGEDAIYGRHWGSIHDYKNLHFEACYYGGIEYCINEGKSRFDAGAQGEHKLKRGFIPVPTYSAHWIQHKSLSDGIRAFCQAENKYINEYQSDCKVALPFSSNYSIYNDWESLDSIQKEMYTFKPKP